MEGVDAESAVPPPAVVFLHVVSVVRGVGDAPEEIPAKWAHRFLQMDMRGQRASGSGVSRNRTPLAWQMCTAPSPVSSRATG